MADLWLAFLVTSAICGFTGYLFAVKTGRNQLLWTAIGVFLNVFCLALLMRKDSQSGRSVS